MCVFSFIINTKAKNIIRISRNFGKTGILIHLQNKLHKGNKMTAIFSNPEDIKKVNGALGEISNAMLRMDAEKNLIKEIKTDILEQFKDKLTAKSLNKLAKTYYKDNFNEKVDANDEFEYLYEVITSTKVD